MSQFFQIHPTTPQKRLIRHTVDIILSGGVIAYPTDSAYALGCLIGDKKAVERIRRIRNLSEKHNFTLVCRDLSELALYAVVNNSQYRLLKTHTPGAYTFILKGSREVPRCLMNPKRKTIGIRVPNCIITQEILAELGGPLMSTTLHLPSDDKPMINPHSIREALESQLDLVIDGGHCAMTPSTVISLLDDAPVIIREGKGDISAFIP